jgi:minor histocompatibility antigen H13
MKAKDAYMYPFIAGGFLVGLYVLFKFLNKDYINILLNAYFLLFGTLSVVATLRYVPLSVPRRPRPRLRLLCNY